MQPGPSCSLSEHTTSRRDDMFWLFAIDLKKKKKTQKHRNSSPHSSTKSERPCRTTCATVVDSGETSSPISVGGRKATRPAKHSRTETLAQTLYRIALLLLLLFSSSDAIIVSATHHPPLQPPLSLAGGPPSALPQPPLTFFLFFTLLSTLCCSDAGLLRLLGH